MKLQNIIIMLFVATLSATAQMTPEQSAAKAKEILNKVSAQNKKQTSFQATFTFTLDNKQENITEKYDGNILVKGNKYRLMLMNTITYFDGTAQYTWMKESNEVNISSAEDEDGNETLNPATVFNIYEKGFKLKYIGDKVVDNISCNEIDLYPEDRNKPYSRIKLMVDKAKNQIYSLMQQGKDGNNYTVKVVKLLPNAAATDKDFTFDKAAHPKVQIIDMR